jgi:hypothetical protein
LFGTPALRKVNPSSPSSPEGDASATLQEDVLVADALDSKLDEIKSVWPGYLKRVQTERIHVGALLQHAEPLDLREESLVLAVPDEFHRRMLSSQQDFLLDHLKSMASTTISRISYVIDLNGSDQPGGRETGPEIDPYEYMQRKRQESPVIRAIFDEFGGEMVW